MDISKLIRNPEQVHACLKETEDNQLIALKPVKIHIPARYAERSMAQIGAEIYITAIYGMIVEDTYFASSTVNAMMKITPTTVSHVEIDGDEYLEFFFEKGSVITPSTNLVKQSTFVYRIYEEILGQGHVPWYLDYLRLGRLFETAPKHAGANIGDEQEVTELIVSMIARSRKDRHLYYRSVVKTLDEIQSNSPAFIALRSLQYGATNTLNKLAGSYFNEGTVSALVNPATRPERIEKLLTA